MIASIIQAGKQEGMQSMDDSLMALVDSGQVSAEAAYMKATEKARFEARIGNS